MTSTKDRKKEINKMAKAVPDNTMDAELDYIALSTSMIACNAEPTNYTEATATYALADVVMAGGDFAKANDTNGRKVTMATKTGVVIDVSGTATHVALVRVADTTLRLVTTCNSQVLTAGGGATVDFPVWKHNLQDPT